MFDPYARVQEGDTLFLGSILRRRGEANYYQEVLDYAFSKLHFFDNQRILEVGTGTGVTVRRLIETYKNRRLKVNVVASDPSADMVGFAKIDTPADLESIISYEVADGEQLPHPKGVFDIIYAATVLVHATDPNRIFSEMVRVTRPGGEVMVLDQDFYTATIYSDNPELSRKILKFAADYWNNGDIGRRLKGMFVKEKLQNIQIYPWVRVDNSYDEAFFKRMTNWILEQGKVTETEVKDFLESLEMLDKEGSFFFSRNFYVITGKKL